MLIYGPYLGLSVTQRSIYPEAWQYAWPQMEGWSVKYWHNSQFNTHTPIQYTHPYTLTHPHIHSHTCHCSDLFTICRFVCPWLITSENIMNITKRYVKTICDALSKRINISASLPIIHQSLVLFTEGLIIHKITYCPVKSVITFQ